MFTTKSAYKVEKPPNFLPKHPYPCNHVEQSTDYSVVLNMVTLIQSKFRKYEKLILIY